MMISRRTHIRQLLRSARVSALTEEERRAEMRAAEVRAASAAEAADVEAAQAAAGTEAVPPRSAGR